MFKKYLLNNSQSKISSPKISQNNELSKIESSIQQKGREIRQMLIETDRLKEKNYPNLTLITQRLVLKILFH